ncbi:phage integrase SAM-like domain-containing protein [Flagellimonas sp.]|uniref:phage integrase SAM-like domain-containing protein n=1 Tax=Flagellimonas sp. TaxID=2058762 RepID=UPI003B51BDE0
MASIKFLLQGKNDPANIVVLLSLGRGKQFKRLTGKEVSLSNWKVEQKTDDKKVVGRAGMPKQRNVELKNLHTELEAFKVNLRRLLNKALEQGEFINGGWLESAISKINNRNPIEEVDLLTNVIKKRIENAEIGIERLSTNRIKGYKTFLSVINRYEKEGLDGRKVVVRNIDKAFGQTFIRWLLDEGYSIGYAAKNIDNLKAICNYAESEGLQVSPMLKYIKPPQQRKIEREEEKPIIYLSEEEQVTIKELKLSSPALENARKWLLFGCVIGQRGGDLLDITHDNIVIADGMTLLEITQKKTDKQVSIPLLPQAIEIVEQGLPYKISIQKFNQYIKKLCELAGINELTPGAIRPSREEGQFKDSERKILPSVKGSYPKYQLIGSHVCRRSFATNFYGKIPTSILIGITGHSTETMFLNYIGKRPRDKAKLMMEYFNSLKKDENPLVPFKIVKNYGEVD